MTYERRVLAERLRDRLDPGERLFNVVVVTGPLARRPSPGAVIGDKDTLAKRFRAHNTTERSCVLGITDRRLIFWWLTPDSADSALPRQEVTGVELSGRRLLGVRFLLHLADDSTLEFATSKKWGVLLAETLGSA